MPTNIPVPPVIPSNVPDYPSEQTRHPGLLEKVREKLRLGHYSLRTLILVVIIPATHLNLVGT